MQVTKNLEDLELDSDLLGIVNELVRPKDLARVAIRAAILSALPEINLSEEDQQIVRDWLEDVKVGRM